MKIKLFIAIIGMSGFLGCSSDKLKPNQKNPNWTSDISISDLVQGIKQQQDATDNNNNDSFFPDDANSQVKITGTEKIILIEQKYLDAPPNDLSESLFIVWAMREDKSNDDVIFKGQTLQIEKSLIADIKQAIDSQSYEIKQATIDAKKKDALENSFTFTFHRSENGYWRPETSEDYDFDLNRQVPVKESDYNLAALKKDLDAAPEDLPDQVVVELNKETENPSTSILETQVDIETWMVPKSVIADIKTEHANNGKVSKDEETWILLASFNSNTRINLKSSP